MLRLSVRIFLAGLFTVLPLVITVAVVIWVAGFVNGFLGQGTVLGRLLEGIGLQFVTGTTFAYVIGWVIVLGVVFGMGVLVEFGAKRWIHERMDGVARRIPMLGGVYGTVRQLVGMMDMDTKDKADLKGMRVVFCVFGDQTGAAFLALLPTPEAFRIGEVDYHAVLVPTAPMPVGGSLMFVPAGSVRPANVSVDAFMSIYVSMGVTGPQFLESAGK